MELLSGDEWSHLTTALSHKTALALSATNRYAHALIFTPKRYGDLLVAATRTQQLDTILYLIRTADIKKESYTRAEAVAHHIYTAFLYKTSRYKREEFLRRRHMYRQIKQLLFEKIKSS